MRDITAAGGMIEEGRWGDGRNDGRLLQHQRLHKTASSALNDREVLITLQRGGGGREEGRRGEGRAGKERREERRGQERSSREEE